MKVKVGTFFVTSALVNSGSLKYLWGVSPLGAWEQLGMDGAGEC